MALIKKHFHIFSLLILSFLFLQQTSFAQLNRKTLKEFKNLEYLTEKGDYRGALFYANKTEKFIAKKTGAQSSESLLLQCYKALLNDKLDNTKEFKTALSKINTLYPLAKKDSSKSNLLKVYIILSDLSFNKGIYNATDSIHDFLKQHQHQLLPYERMELKYYSSLSNYKKGFLNEVSKSINSDLQKLEKSFIQDSIYNKKSTLVSYANISKEDNGERLLLYGKFITLKGNILIDNGLSDSALLFVNNHYHLLKKQLGSQKGIIAEIHHIRGQCYLNNDEFAMAEREFKEALAYSKIQFFHHSNEVIEIQHSLIKSLLEQEENEEAEYYNNDVDVKVTGYYGKHSFAYLKNQYTDIEQEIALQNWSKAERMLKEFIDSPLLPELNEQRLQALLELFKIKERLKEYEDADYLIIKATALQEMLLGKTAPALHAIELKRAEFYTTRLNRFNEAKQIFNAHMSASYLSHIAPTNPDYINAVLIASTLYEFMDEYVMAADLVATGLKQVENYLGKDNEVYATLLTRKADLEISRGLFKEANNSIDLSIDLFSNKMNIKYVQQYSIALETKAKLKIILGDYQEASRLLEQAKDNLKKIAPVDAADLSSMEETALVYIYTGKYLKAEKYLSRLLSEREDAYGKEHKSLITILLYTGELKLELGNYSEADNYFERASSLASKIFGNKSTIYANCLLYYKKMYSLLGDSEKAASVMEEVVKLYEKTFGKENAKLGMILHEYVLAKMEAHIYSKNKKDISKDLDALIIQSFKIIKNEFGDQSPAYANALEDAALYYILSGRTNLALESVKQSQQIWTKKLGETNINNARLTLLSGKIYARAKAYDKAVSAFESSKHIYKDLFNDEHPGYVESLGECAKMYYMLNKKDEVVKNIEECTEKSLAYIDKIFPVLSEKGKEAFWNKIKDNLEFYKIISFNETYHQKYPEMIGTVFNIQIKTRAILLNSLLKVKQQIMASGDTTAIKLYQQLLEERENLALSYSLTNKQLAEMGVDIKGIESHIDELEKSLTAISYDFVSTSKKTIDYNWTNLRKHIEEGELLLEVVPYREYNGQFTDTIRYAILALDENSKSPAYIIIKNGNELERKGLKNYRNSIKFEVNDKLSYGYFWKPVEALIKPEHKKIFFVNDGVYNQINLETLKNSKGEYFINTLNIFLVSTSRDLFERKKVTTNRKQNSLVANASLLGNPLYYTNDNTTERNVQQLPGSEREVKLLDSLLKQQNWKTTLVTNRELTEELIKNQQSPNVLHISTHGFYMDKVATQDEDILERKSDNPLLRSGLLLSNGGALIQNATVSTINSEDGVLTAYEAMNMVLDNTDLVVLSACETGLGEVVHGEGVFGLQRSFQVAGAKTVIVSLFRVSDEVTQKLMVTFYQNWLRTKDKYASFTEAKKTIMKEYPSPKYWGAFIILGVE